MQIKADQGSGYTNDSYNMSGHIVWAGGSNTTQLRIESEELVMPRGETYFFYSDGTPNEKGKARMVYAVKFGY